MNWPIVTLEQITTRIRNGLSIRQSSAATGLPITRIETISDSTINPNKVGYADLAEGDAADYFLEPGDILLSHINSESHIGKCAIYEGQPDPLVHGMNLLCIRANLTVVDPRFLLHLLRSPKFRSQLPAITKRAVNQASISIGNLRTVRCVLPTLQEQRRVIKLLELADTLRRERKEADGFAALILPTLFQKIFGEIERNPRGWPVGPLKQLGKPCSGGAFPLNKQGLKEGAVPFIKVSDMNLPGNERFIRSANHYVSRETLAELGVRTAPAGTIVFPKIGAAIATNKKRLLTRDTAFDNNVQGVTPLKPESTFYLYAFFERFDLMRLARVTTLPSIRPTELAELPVQSPPLELQAEFGRIYEQTCGTFDQQAQSRTSIETLFQTMLHRAFTGELTAGWREAHMKELLAEMEIQSKILKGNLR